MFNSQILDTVISLAFIYLLFSLFASTIKEGFAGLGNWRGKMLKNGIAALLGDANKSYTIKEIQPKPEATPGTPSSYSLVQGTFKLDKIYDHPRIKNLIKTESRVLSMKPFSIKKTDRLPSYIADKDFAVAYLSNLLPGVDCSTMKIEDCRKDWASKNVELTPEFNQFLIEIGNESGSLSQGVMDWYNAGMDRVGGWYKRKAQHALIIIALLLVPILNVDTLKVTQQIYASTPLRAAVVAAAGQPIQQDTNDNGKNFKLLNQQITALGLPIGWKRNPICDKTWDDGQIPAKIAGWFLTILALSLGAPFWFDLLSKVSNLRNAGTKPAETTGKTDTKKT